MPSVPVRCGSFVIKRKQLIIPAAWLLAGALAYGALLGWRAYPDLKQEYRARTCSSLGAIDASKMSDNSPSKVWIVGRVADRAGVERVELVSGNVLLSTAIPTALRSDAIQVSPACPAGVAKSFDVPLELDKLGKGDKVLSLYAVRPGGSRYKVGEVPGDVFSMIVHVESRTPVQWDGSNYISGWAFSRSGPVDVSVLAGKKLLARTRADGLREDVGKIFPLWPGAAHSAFGIPLHMATMPRGRYHLNIQFSDESGHRKLLPGPEVVNDLPIGKVIAQADRLVDPKNVHLEAWLADEAGIRSAAVETESGIVLGALHPLARDVPLSALPDPRFAAMKNDLASLKSGDLYAINIPRRSIPEGLNRLVVRVRDRAGKVAMISSGPLVLRGGEAAPPCRGRTLRVFYPGGAVNFRNGFRQMTEFRKMVQGGCVEVGMRGRTEYLRTTFGKQQDFRFDPDFPEALRKRSAALEMTGESIRELLNTALRFKVPLMVTLDGGVWANAKFPAPDVDVVDNLEEDPRTVQWNQFGRAEPRDALDHLPGATASPQLARMMSLNRYNKKFRAYKKRNLQAAIRVIVQFMHDHPKIYVMVNLDPDEYINPWFYQTQWYDYNPDTLRQFREWLFHLGPYADGGELAFSRHEPKLSLEQVNQIAKQSWKTLAEVDPPRGTPDYSDPWQQLWTQFKRHLVARHYDDLAAWAAQAGMPADRIFTSQTFIQTDVATRISDPATGWTDQAGVSIEGAKPRQGHLGAILYGPASRNEGKVRTGTSLIGNIRRIDPEWGVVEFNPATIAFPDKLATQAEAYATMLALINGGAHFLSPMWGSYAADRVVHPNHFKAYDAMEGTAFEYQLVWWLRKMRFLPVGSRFYPFGNDRVKSADGWVAGAGTTVTLEAGRIQLSGKGSHVSVVSPDWDEPWKTSPMRVEIKGRWPKASVVGASLVFDNGRREQLFATRSSSGMAVFRMAKQAHPLKELELEWSGEGHHPIRLHDVEIDSIAVRTENKS